MFYVLRTFSYLFFTSYCHQACQKLFEKMKQQFSKNHRKVEQYARRNIFASSIPQPGRKASQSSLLHASSPHSSSELLERVTGEVEMLKERYLELRQKHNELACECHDTDLLLKDMRQANFQLNVGRQVLEEKLPLAETMTSMNRNREDLEILSKQALGILLCVGLFS